MGPKTTEQLTAPMKPRPLILCYDLAVADYALAMAKASPCIVVLNPHDGTGTARDRDYEKWQQLSQDLSAITHEVEKLDKSRLAPPKKKKVMEPTLVLGYVECVNWNGDEWTLKKARPFGVELKTWSTQFKVGGVWLDDFFADRDGFRDLLTSARFHQPWKVAINPGEEPAPWCWISADFVCDYEGNRPQDFTGLPKRAPSYPNAVRIARGTARSRAVIESLAYWQNLAGVCITDVMNYQEPPTWGRR